MIDSGTRTVYIPVDTVASGFLFWMEFGVWCVRTVNSEATTFIRKAVVET